MQPWLIRGLGSTKASSAGFRSLLAFWMGGGGFNSGGGNVDDGSMPIFIRRHRGKPVGLFRRR